MKDAFYSKKLRIFLFKGLKLDALKIWSKIFKVAPKAFSIFQLYVPDPVESYNPC